MRWILLALAMLLVPKPALAWGNQGHQLTCQIAYGLLTPKAKSEVDRLLATQQPKYRKFAPACTYADAVKFQDGRQSWHFVNLRRTDSALSPGTPCPVASSPTACLLPAIELDYATLADKSASAAVRGKALMYFGHWLGDLHQPLHISFKDDIGGNKVETTGACAPRGGSTYLHSIWDTCIIVQRIYANRPKVDLTDDPRFYTVTDQLRAAITPEMRTDWLAGTTMDWANASFAISTSASVGYCTKMQGACWYSPTLMIHGDEDARSFEIDDDYLTRFAPRVIEQLQRGGVRLADRLNRALDPGYTG